MTAALAAIVAILTFVVAYLYLRAAQQAKALKELTENVSGLRSDFTKMRTSEAIIIPDVVRAPARKRKSPKG